MRLCRIAQDDLVFPAYYFDDHVVPLSAALEAYLGAHDDAEDLELSESLLDFLPPDGPAFETAQAIEKWLSSTDDFDELAIPVGDVKLLVPIPNPPKILLLAGNYAAHVVERGGTAAERMETFPYVFMKPPSTTLTHPDDPIVIPSISPDHIDWECELGVVIGRRCHRVTEAEALNYVAGYMVINDITDRRYTPNPGRKSRERDKFFDWLHGKWHDTFCPTGPCITSSDEIPDPQDLRLTLALNGAIRQAASTSQMVFPVASVIAFISQFVTLEPGDFISTGTPGGVGSATGNYLKPGDHMEATIAKIGTLRTPVIAES